MKDSRLSETQPCCPDEKILTPLSIQNSPRQSEIRYRIGTFSSFKAGMLSALPRKAALSKLTTRSEDDLSIALLDAWAIIGDVLTFYQERIANEGFLRTSKERKSIMELASSLGYELSSGVAASTFLAFTIEESGVVKEISIQMGTKAQSLPGPDQMPQVFETIETITARPELNNLRPKLKKPQEISDDRTRFIFDKMSLAIEPGDGLLIIFYVSKDTVWPSFRIVSKVTEDPVSKSTIVDVDVVTSLHSIAEGGQRIRIGTGGLATRVASSASLFSGAARISGRSRRTDARTQEGIFKIATREPVALREAISGIRDQSDLESIAVELGVDPDTLVSAMNSDVTRYTREAVIGLSGPEVYIFRAKAGVFGNRAPPTKPSVQDPPQDPVKIADLPVNKAGSGPEEYYDPHDQNLMYLDNSYPKVMPRSWIALRNEMQQYVVYQVSQTIERSLSLEYFDMTATTTGLKLDTEADQNYLQHFSFRGTTVYAQGERLNLSLEEDLTPVVGGNTILLDKTVRGLAKGRPIVISGRIISSDGGQSGLEANELAIILDIVQEGPFTKLVFEKPIEKNYDKKTISLNANVTKATHGESKHEVLGSGDPSKQLQEFILKSKPLTYVPSPSASGAESTLEVRVNRILWKEIPSLYNAGPDEHVYITRNSDDNQTHIIFGDGFKGGRPNAGIGNIEAKYRVGMGSDGMVEQGQISILISRALGVKSVVNPTKPSGAEDSEDLENARQNAPISAITMDRIVSLEDFEYFARAFRGIEKAQAIWLWDGHRNIVHLTVAPASGDPLEDTSSLRANLIKAINISKDPMASFRVDTFIPRFFNLKAKILIARDRQQEDVLKAVTATLVKEFSFKSRKLGEPVTKSEIIALIQSVDGVIASDIDLLYLVRDGNISRGVKEEEDEDTRDFIPSSLAHLEDKKVLGAELVMINSKGLSLSVMQS